MAGYSVEKALEDRKKRIKEEEYNARYREALKDPEGYANKNKPISVEDALKERKKSLSENSGSIKNDIARRYNSVLSSYKFYANNYSDSLYGEGSVKKTLDKQRSTRKETASLVSDIKAYRKIIGEKEADDMLKNLDSMKGVYDYAYEAAKVYTNFKSEEDYQDFMNPTSDVIPVGNGAMSPFRKGGLSPIGANSPGGIYSFDPMMKQTALGQLPFELNKNKDPLPTEDVKDENRLALYVYYTEKAREAESNGGSEEEIKAYRQQAEKARSKEGYQEIMSGWLNNDFELDDETVNARQAIYERKMAEIKRLEQTISYTPDGEEKENLVKRKEALEAETNIYTRNQKVLDDYYGLRNNADFGTASRLRQYNNPTKEELDKADFERISFDRDYGKIKDYIEYTDEANNEYVLDDGTRIKIPQQVEVKDKLGLFLSAPATMRETADINAYSSGNYTWSSIVSDGNNFHWDLLKKEEIDTYYYLFNTQGQQAAYDFLDSMQTTLGRRHLEEETKEYNDSSVLNKIILNLASVPSNVVGGIPASFGIIGAIANGKEINPYSPEFALVNSASNLRGNTAKDIEEATGGVAIPGIDFSFGDFYQSIMSGADSFVGAKMFGRGYTVIMGMNAASSEAKDLYDKGATKEQIILGASAAGAAEMIFEYVSLDHFLKNMDKGTKLKRQWLKQVLAQAGVEASEEVFTEIANTLTNAWVMKSQSEWAKLKEEGGLKNAFIETCKNVINAGIGGFVSGGGMAAVGSTANLIHYNNYSRGVGTQINEQGNTQNLIDYAEKIVLEYDKLFPGADTKQIGKFVSQLKQSIANGGEMSKSDLTKTGKLYDLVSDAVQKHSVQAVKSKIFDKLQGRADINYKSYTAKLLTNAFFDNMSDTEKAAFKRMKGQKILDSLLSDSDTSDFLNAYKNLYDNGADFIFDRNANTATGNINSDVSQYTEQPAQTANTPLSLAPSETVRENSQGFGQDISAPRVEETPTATTQDNTDRERSAEALNYALEDIDNKHISKAATDLIKAEYDGTLSAADYVAGMEEGFNFGYSQVPEDGLTDYSGPFGQLSAMQKKHSYNLGVLAREEETRKRKTEIQAKIKDATEKSSGKNKDITFGRKIGTVKGEGVTIADLKKTFNDTQNKAYKILSTTAEITGVDIVLYKSEADENGNFTGAQGKFKYSEDKLYIDINAGLLNEMDASELGAYAMVRTFCHEFVHFIEKWNVKGYNELRNLTFQTLQSRGINVDTEIRNTMDKLALDDYDKASREVVAETFTDVLPDSKFAQNIAEKNPGLLKKILEKLKEFLENVKSYFRSLGKNGSRVANAMKEEVNGQIRYIQNIVDVFDKVAEQAVENYQRTFAVNDTFESESAENISENIKAAVNEAIDNRGSFSDKWNQRQLSPVPEEISALVEKSSDGAIDLSNKRFALNGSDIWHEYNRHKESKEYENGQIPLTRESISEAIEAFYAPDSIETVFFDADNPTQRKSFLYTKKKNGHYMVVLAVGGKYNPNVTPSVILNLSEKKYDNVISSGKTFAELLFDNDPKKKNSLDIERIKKNKVIVARPESKDASASPHSPLSADSIAQSVKDVKPKNKTSLSDYEKAAGIAQKIIKASTKDRKPIRLSDGDMFFVGNPSCVAVVDKETFDSFGDEILTNKSAEFTRLLDMKRQKLTGAAYSYKPENGKNLLYIKDKDGGVLLDKKYAKFFDGYDFYCDPENERVPVLFKDGNGEVVGLLAQMHKVGNINTDNLDVVKMKSFPVKNVVSTEKNNERENKVKASREDSNETTTLPPDTEVVYDYGDRPVKKKRKKHTTPDEYESNYMSWARGSAKVGTTKILPRYDYRAKKLKYHYYEKTADGCVELSYKQYCERENDYATEIDRRATSEISETPNIVRSSEATEIRNSDGDRYTTESGSVYRQTVGEKLRSDTGRGVSTVDRGIHGDREVIDDEQYQQRTDTLTDRRVLELAAEDVRIDDLTQGEVYALDVFKKRLEAIRDLQTQRKEQGQLYKEQQFGSKTDKAEAVKTLNRMKILDDQIKKASAELLSVEEKEVLKRVLQRARKVIEAKDREETKEILRRQSERRKESEAVRKYRQRIKLDVSDISSWITNPNNKTSVNRVPDVLKNSVIPFLTSIDFTSKRQLRGGAATRADREFANRLEKLQGALKTNGEVNGLYSGYNDLPPNFTERLQSFVNAVHTLTQGENDGYVINRMTGEQLKELSKIVRTLKKFIKEMNVFHYNAVFSHVSDAAENTISSLREIGDAGNFENGVSNFIFWRNVRPAYAFERFGEGGKAIYDEFRRAQSTLAFHAKEIIDFAEKAYTTEEVKTWRKDYKEFNLDGDTVKMPVSYIMGLYELSKQPDSLRHILGDGIRIARHTFGKEKIQDVGHRLSESDVQEIIGVLTERQKEVADALQSFMATQGAAWGNYVSVKRFGERLFTNPQYYPISSDGRYLESTADEQPQAASLYALLNMSFTKRRNENADNRIVIFDIFDVFANHMASMAQYNAFALPILDALKWFNYKQILIDETTGAKEVIGSVRDEMNRVYGGGNA